MNFNNVLEGYLDYSIFQPNNIEIPLIKVTSIDKICSELQYAILAYSRIMIYGDYDADGLFSMLVWKEVFDCLGYTNYFLYQYTRKTHHISSYLLQQAMNGKAEYIIICDTGCSLEDHFIITELRTLGVVVIVIDHHLSVYNYNTLQKEINVFNSYEERSKLNDNEISAAYASLLVANILCIHFLHKPLSNNAKCYALASMYADMVDMSSNYGIALYNHVVFYNLQMPLFMQGFNLYNYRISRRFFQQILSPRMNVCFRSENFQDLNSLLAKRHIIKGQEEISNIVELHKFYSKLISQYSLKFLQKHFGNIICCIYEPDGTELFHQIRNFSGLIANHIASIEKCAVVTLIKMRSNYQGSFRDPYKRDFLSTFRLFCEAAGHPSAFGLSVLFDKLDFFFKNLEEVSLKINVVNESKYIFLPRYCIKTLQDLEVISLYNEYMSTNKVAVIKMKCQKVILKRTTPYHRYYDVDLPLQVTCTSALIQNSTLTVEPCICQQIQLREVMSI